MTYRSRVLTQSKYHDITALSVVLEYDIANTVPLNGDISFADLSQKVGFDAGRLERILRLLFVRHIFTESRPGFVAHSPVSAYLAENKELAAFLGHCTGEAFPAASKLTETIRKYPYTEEPNQTGFNLALGTDDPLFTFLSKNPKRFDRFNLGMAGISQAGGRSAKQVVEGYDWGSLGEGTVVDVRLRSSTYTPCLRADKMVLLGRRRQRPHQHRSRPSVSSSKPRRARPPRRSRRWGRHPLS